MATVTINTTAGEDARLGPAFGAKLGLPGNANAAQIKADVVAYMTTVVRDQERLANQASFTGGYSPIAPT